MQTYLGAFIVSSWAQIIATITPNNYAHNTKNERDGAQLQNERYS